MSAGTSGEWLVPAVCVWCTSGVNLPSRHSLAGSKGATHRSRPPLAGLARTVRVDLSVQPLDKDHA
jgi:hypothetical protein